MEQNKRIVVGMSGGIDSSAVCLLLQEQGYEVVGVTLRTWDVPSHFSSSGQELPDEVMEAQALAARLGIEHHVADVRQEFRETIVRYFVDEYLRGRTPNPCVWCNPLLKERILCEWADRTGCRQVATGHYCRLEDRGGLRYIVAGDDDTKDQSYFLWRLPQSLLQRMVFPLGGLTKASVREYLARKGFVGKARGGESMEVCFIEGDYRDFLRRQCPDIDRLIGPGWFVDPQGRKLGRHKGCAYYTIGQRKGLEIALGKPAYVLKINPDKNTVMLGDAEQLKAEYMLIEEVRFTDEAEVLQAAAQTEAVSTGIMQATAQAEAALTGTMQATAQTETAPADGLTVRIRYRSRPIPCSLQRIDEERWLVHFRGEASAIAPGQSAVFYIGQRVVGGAYIASQRGIGQYISAHEG